MSNTTSKSTGLETADLLINTGKAILTGVQIITDQTNDATLILYDNTSAAGTEVFKQIVTGTDDSKTFWFGDGGIRCSTGLYADIAGTAAEYIVFYK